MKSEGMRLLVAQPSLPSLAEKIGVSKATIYRWRDGKKVPDPHHRVALFRLAGIPPLAWGTQAGAPLPEPQVHLPVLPPPDSPPVPPPAPDPVPTHPVAVAPARPRRPARTRVSPEETPRTEPTPTPIPPAHPEPVLAPAIPPVSGTSLEEACALIQRIRVAASAPGLMRSELARLQDAETRAIALRAKLERDQELFEDRVVREHPFWARIRTAILDALRPHPEATRDVIAALDRIGA